MDNGLLGSYEHEISDSVLKEICQSHLHDWIYVFSNHSNMLIEGLSYVGIGITVLYR